MNFKPTEEQKKIFHFIKNRPENVLIKAYAGCGKTSTILESINYIPKDKSIMFLAFNRHISEELKTKLPEGVYCYTTYGLGNAAIKRKYKDSITFDEFKADKCILKKSKSWGLNEEFDSEEEIGFYLNSMKKLVNLCRLTLTIKEEYIPYIAERHDINLQKTKDVKRVMKVMDTMTNDRKLYDYIDMVYLPAVDNSIWMFPQDYVILDECIPGNTYISTIDGKFKIKTLCNDFNKHKKPLPKIMTYNETTKTFEIKKINNIWSNGVHDTYSVMLGTKRKLCSTRNHKFLTLNGWKRLDELKCGDAVLSNYNNQPYHFILNDQQKDIVIGSLLGDGNINVLSKNISRIRIIHGKKQREYLEWKSTFFDTKIEYIEKNGYSSTPAYTFTTKGFYYNLDVEDAIKSITVKSLAISWMDDGSLSKKGKSGTLFSLAKNKFHVELLSKILYEKWKIVGIVCTSKSSTTKKDYHYLRFCVDDMRKLSNLISPYVHDSMKYKILIDDWKNIKSDNWKKTTLSNVGCIVVTKEYEYYKTECVYDMSVEDNHNFIVTSLSRKSEINKSIAGGFGIITHNCQDFNRCQIRIVEKILKKDKFSGKTIGRLISVGDFFQGVYGFNGADEKSFKWFETYPNTKVLPLSYSFRCAKNIITKANEIVPEIKALDNAPEGVVRDGSVLDEADSGDFVLCRTTMPLVKLFFEFLLKHKKAIIKGSDIGTHLVELIGKIKNIDKLTTFWETELNKYRLDLKSKGVLNPYEHSGYVTLEDKVSTLLFIAKMSDSIPNLKENIATIFTDDIQGIVLSTIHKIKGLESNRVFIVRPDLLPLPNARGWQYAQEMNLSYVAITRARLELIYDRVWTDEE